MYVETSSIHKCGKIWINSIETFLSTFEISQSHIISYLPRVFSPAICMHLADVSVGLLVNEIPLEQEYVACVVSEKRAKTGIRTFSNIFWLNYF